MRIDRNIGVSMLMQNPRSAFSSFRAFCLFAPDRAQTDQASGVQGFDAQQLSSSCISYARRWNRWDLSQSEADARNSNMLFWPRTKRGRLIARFVHCRNRREMRFSISVTDASRFLGRAFRPAVCERANKSRRMPQL
jgi:hypothetical protein